jgi:hypothetical protein
MKSIQQLVRPNSVDREDHSSSIVGWISHRRADDHSSAAGFLGVFVDALDFAGTEGASVVGSVAGSSAARVGLAAGDTITSVNGIGIATANALGAVLSTQRPGDHVTLTWVTPYRTAHLAIIRLSRAPDVDVEVQRPQTRSIPCEPKRRTPKSAQCPIGAKRGSDKELSGRDRSVPTCPIDLSTDPP